MRTALLLVVPALLLVSFTVARPGPLPAPSLPPSFDVTSALATTTELAHDHPIRVPGTALADSAARWYTDKLALYGLGAQEDTWTDEIPGLGRVRLRNIVTVVPGDTERAIVIVAHRDNRGQGPGANVNASGTAALIELARGYAELGTVAGRPQPQHTLVFLSSDGGAFGGFGAARFAATSPLRDDLIAVVSLDGIAGRARPRLELSGFDSRSPAPALVRTVSVRVAEQTTREPAHPGWLTQLVDLGIPFGYGEQAPFLERGISAIRLATVGDGSTDGATDTTEASTSTASSASAVRPRRPSRLWMPVSPWPAARQARSTSAIAQSAAGRSSSCCSRRSSRTSSAPSTCSHAPAGAACLSAAPGSACARDSASGSGSAAS